MTKRPPALSILQPWATLIVVGAKDIENRTWATRYRGPLLVHAGKKLDADTFDGARAMMNHAEDNGVDVKGKLAAANIVKVRDCLRGGIVGCVDLVDIVRDHASPWAVPGCFHWVLANPRALPFTPCKGALGLFAASCDLAGAAA